MGGTASTRSCAGRTRLQGAAKPGTGSEDRSTWVCGSWAPTGTPKPLVLTSLYADLRGQEVTQAPDSPGIERLHPEGSIHSSSFFLFKQNSNLTQVQAVKKILEGTQFSTVFSRLKTDVANHFRIFWELRWRGRDWKWLVASPGRTQPGAPARRRPFSSGALCKGATATRSCPSFTAQTRPPGAARSAPCAASRRSRASSLVHLPRLAKPLALFPRGAALFGAHGNLRTSQPLPAAATWGCPSASCGPRRAERSPRGSEEQPPPETPGLPYVAGLWLPVPKALRPLVRTSVEFGRGRIRSLT